ncbi:MAG: hypothetical protein PUC65_06515 [Clostridiales bacterium]|nr:hypothetical protein [Clostridiales bacterium]
MITINRFNYFYSKRQSAPLGKQDWGFDFVQSFKVNVKRWNCVDILGQS